MGVKRKDGEAVELTPNVNPVKLPSEPDLRTLNHARDRFQIGHEGAQMSKRIKQREEKNGRTAP